MLRDAQQAGRSGGVNVFARHQPRSGRLRSGKESKQYHHQGAHGIDLPPCSSFVARPRPMMIAIDCRLLFMPAQPHRLAPRIVSRSPGGGAPTPAQQNITLARAARSTAQRVYATRAHARARRTTTRARVTRSARTPAHFPSKNERFNGATTGRQQTSIPGGETGGQEVTSPDIVIARARR